MSLATIGHAHDGSLTIDNQDGGRNGKVMFPCKLCRGVHLTYNCSHMDEASQLLEDSVVSQQELHVATQESSSIQPLVYEVVISIPSLVVTTPPLKGAFNTTQVFLINSHCPRQRGIMYISKISPSSIEDIPFYWDNLV